MSRKFLLKFIVILAIIYFIWLFIIGFNEIINGDIIINDGSDRESFLADLQEVLN